MIQFRAFVNHDPQRTIADSLAQRWKTQGVFPQLGYERTLHRNNVFMSIHGDCNMESRVYTSPRLDLMCHADLLGSGSCDDFREANGCPAEYLARRYEQKGDDLAQDLRGWFGIVLYDFEQNTLKAWTDHFGIRRIVYRAAPGALAIASDLRLLNDFGSQVPELDPAAILEYLQYTCIPAPRTIYKGTFRLEPGHRLTSRPAISSRAYWDMRYEEKGGLSVKSWASQTYEAIESAVSRASKTADPAHRPGCFLSGGTDSSSISGLVGKLTGRAPTTISIGFDDPRYNEIEYARIAARHFRANHHEYFVKPEDILDLIQKAYTVYDEPFGNSSIVPAYYCARMGAENGVSHMLAGDGGDELFGGNRRYANDRVFQRYSLLPKLVRSHFLEPLVKSGGALSRFGCIDLARRYIRRANIPAPDRYLSYDFLSTVDRDELFSPSFQASLTGMEALAPARRHFRSARAACDLNRWLYLDLKITITDNDLRKVTPMTELAGVVPRYPLLDPVLAEFSGTVPARLKVRGTRLRYLFKQAMTGFLPPEILTKKKHGFGLPFSVWLGEHQALREFVFDILGSSRARERGYLRRDLLEWLMSCRQSDSPIYYGDVLWVFLMLELWQISAFQSLESRFDCSEQRPYV
jgi:asparagine synthase (glutamine-hydrolysing)